jgi:hypothetical protein
MSKLFAYLSYRDVDAAITWLEALGVESHHETAGLSLPLGRVLSPLAPLSAQEGSGA